ncbi:trypsin-like peptidase domain-containing protein [Bacillus luti]|uniref:Trypsin-like peptidase domain-containing protein n=2 Tax=Bacillus luti TaxID=2026191 RepID=A0A7V7S2Y9_9BACI|nr:trypsin-like peptidase domain-containing protein [Bacillus luti]
MTMLKQKIEISNVALMYFTVRIQSGGRVGTGFFFDFSKKQDGSLVFLVTNKHVIAGSDRISFTIHTKECVHEGEYDELEANIYEVDRPFLEESWGEYLTAIFHPNERIDLAFIPVMELLREIKQTEAIPCIHVLYFKHIPTDEELLTMGPMEEVAMIGYPAGLIDEENNFPIFRRGYTATHPYFHYDDKEEFLIDVPTVKGSSGSPVLGIRKVYKWDDDEKSITCEERYQLLGVIYSGYFDKISIESQADEENEVNQSTFEISKHLGVAIHAKQLFEGQEYIYEWYYNTRAGYLQD